MRTNIIAPVLVIVLSLAAITVMGEPSFLPYASKLKDKDIPLSPQPVMRNELNEATEALGIGLLDQDNTAHGALADGQTFFVLDHLEGIELPHADWAKPFAGGPIKVLALGQSQLANDVVQIEQRLDGKLFVALIDRSSGAGNPGGNFGKYNPGHAELYEKLILKRLKDINPDVLLIDAIVKPVLRRPAVAEEIARRVKEGMGVVAMIGRTFDKTVPDVEGPLLPGVIPFDYKNDLARHNKSWPPSGAAHETWSGVPYRVFPSSLAYEMFKLPALPDWTVRAKLGDFPYVLTTDIGKGRVAVFAYYVWYGEFMFPDVGLLKRDNWISPARRARWMDDLSGAYIKMLLWAARRDKGIVFTVDCQAEVKALDKFQTKIAVDKCPNDLNCALTLTVQNERRETVFTEKKNVKLTAKSELAFDIPPLKCMGLYFIDVVARDSSGKSLWWASNAAEVKQGLGLSIQAEKDILKRGDKLIGKVETSGDLEPYGELKGEIEVWDSYGRLLYQQKIPVTKPSISFPFSFDLSYCPARALAIQAKLTASDKIVALAEKEITLPAFGLGDDFYTFMWGIGPYDSANNLNLLRRYGFDGITLWPYGPHTVAGRNTIWNNMDLEIEAGWCNSLSLGGESWPGNPKYEKEFTNLIHTAATQVFKRYGCRCISLGNEQQPAQKLTTDMEISDFRKYLQDEYGQDLQKLNAEWGTAFASWDEVKPSPCKPAELNFAPGLEVQQFMRKTSAREQKRAVDEYCQEMGTNLPWGSTSSGFSIYQAELGSSMYTYNWSGDLGYDIWNQGSELIYANGYEHPESRYMLSPWESLFRGSKCENHYIGYGVVVIYGAFNQRGMWLKKHSAEIRNGIGKLLATSSLQHDPVAILYEENTSFTDYKEWGVMSLFAGENPMDIQSYCRFAIAGRKSMWSLLRDAQVRPVAMTEKQIQEGKLKGIKMLVLSTAGCLSEATAKSIAEWVKGGGLLVADLLPGAFNERGKWRGKSPLDPLFGIERSELKLIQYPPEYTVGILKKTPGFMEDLGTEWFYVQFHEGGFKVTDGVALGKHFVKGESPAFIYKKNGNGAALYLNFIDTEYFRTKDPHHLRFMKALLRQAGVQPSVRLLDPVDKDTRPGYLITRFADDNAFHLGILGGGEEVVLSLNEEANIYDVRKGQYLGKGKEAKLFLLKDYPRLISCLPCRIDGVKIEMPKSVERGDMVKFNVDATLEGKPTSLVYRLEFFNPDGEPVEAYFSKVRAPAGRYAGAIQFALNDKPGNWTIKATEIVSGKSMAYTFKVK